MDEPTSALSNHEVDGLRGAARPPPYYWWYQ
jgi:ABC-type sugar transport system ATPase subunit